MLTFPGPFTVYINYIEAVGLEGIHEKNCKGREEQKQWATTHFGFSIAIDFGLLVATESPSRDRAMCATVLARVARASWPALCER